jgi:periplasmic protein TonB
MFDSMLIEERIKTQRGKTTVLSFFLQALIVTVLVLIPLLFTEALPARMLQTTLVAPPPPPPPPPPAASSAPRHVEPQTPVKSELEVPVKIPQKVAMVHEQLPQSDQMADAAPAAGGVMGGVPGGVAGGTVGGVVGGVLNSVGTAMPKLAAPKRVKVSSGVTQGLLVKKVTPQYPPLAKSAHIEGTVVLQAVIGKDGTVQNLRVISGHPMLSQAALEAVKQWKYKPYMLNGQATEIDTSIQVNFKLSS